MVRGSKILACVMPSAASSVYRVHAIAPIGVAATPTSGSSIACMHSSPTVRRGMGVKLPDMCCTNGACYDCFVPHPFKCKVLWADITFLEVEDCVDSATGLSGLAHYSYEVYKKCDY